MPAQAFLSEDRPYSCADVLGVTGVSRNALFNYERHGIAQPQRGSNGYRAYSLNDMLDIMCCTMLLSMGYSVSEAAEVLHGDDIMGIGPIDTYLERLERQRDVAQAKVDNLYALRSVITEAMPTERAPLHLVECPPWLFFLTRRRVPNAPKPILTFVLSAAMHARQRGCRRPTHASILASSIKSSSCGRCL